jgi:hypothetical protein
MHALDALNDNENQGSQLDMAIVDLVCPFALTTHATKL